VLACGSSAPGRPDWKPDSWIIRGANAVGPTAGGSFRPGDDDDVANESGSLDALVRWISAVIQVGIEYRLLIGRFTQFRTCPGS
jgi:hypothetical protein